MNIRKWLYLFCTSLLIGAVASIVVGIYFQATDPELSLSDPTLYIFNAGVGFTFSALSQMGFFAYLTLQYIARAMIRRKMIWTTLQWIIIVIAFVDLIILRTTFLSGHEDMLQYTIFPLALFICALIVAIWKKELTNSSAFTPTLFFMFVATALECVPALQEQNAASTITMAIPLVLCNAWQILNLHRLVGGAGSVSDAAQQTKPA